MKPSVPSQSVPVNQVTSVNPTARCDPFTLTGTYRCLSVWQPWAWAIFHGKSIENRDWPVRFIGRLLIHAAKTTQDVERVSHLISHDFKLTVPPDLQFGVILGIVDITGCTYSKEKSPCGWGMPNTYHWHLANQTLFTTPIPWRGQQNIFHVTCPFPKPTQTLI